MRDVVRRIAITLSAVSAVRRELDVAAESSAAFSLGQVSSLASAVPQGRHARIAWRRATAIVRDGCISFVVVVVVVLISVQS